MKTLIFLLLLPPLLLGCAAAPAVNEPNAPSYLSVRRIGQGAWIPGSQLRTAAWLEASSRCEALGKPLKVFGIKDTPSSVFGRVAQTELLFRCEN